MLLELILTTDHLIGIALLLGAVIGFTVRTGWLAGKVVGDFEDIKKKVDLKADKSELSTLRTEYNQKLDQLVLKTDQMYKILIQIAQSTKS